MDNPCLVLPNTGIATQPEGVGVTDGALTRKL